MIGAAFAAVLLSFGTQAPAAAPPPAAVPRAIFLRIAPQIVVQGEGVANHRVMPPLSDSALGVSVAVGRTVTPALAVEAEAVWTSALTTDQQFTYTWRQNYTAGDRDVLFNVNLRYRESWLEVFGGGGLAVTTMSRRSIVQTGPGAHEQSSQPDESTTSVHPTASAGIGVVLPAGARVDVVPHVGARWIRRGRTETSADLGVSARQWFAGVSVRIGIGR